MYVCVMHIEYVQYNSITHTSLGRCAHVCVFHVFTVLKYNLQVKSNDSMNMVDDREDIQASTHTTQKDSYKHADRYCTMCICIWIWIDGYEYEDEYEYEYEYCILNIECDNDAEHTI